MNEHDRSIEELRLFDQLCSTLYLSAGFEQVKKNKGKPGIDGVTIADFEARLGEELSRLQQEWQDWTYPPSPVRRVEIPKPGGKGVRLLGIPTVRDRVVQTTLKLLLEPIFDPHFSEHSYGAIRPILGTHPSGRLSAVQKRSGRFCRPGWSQHQAVLAAQRTVESGKPYVVDID